ncbi:MAG TPA: choice-of-anchor tandem repeat GloVer-containing protein [Candidatus Sulfotelmatobacter sp.]
MYCTVRPNPRDCSCRLALCIFLGAVLPLCATTIARGQTLTPLYQFQGGADGASPNGVINDFAGNLYGTTIGGGQTIFGTLFKLSPSGTKTILYNFTGGTDGGEPHGTLIRDAKGNLYGTTEYGGDLNVQCVGMQGCGVVFKISPRGHETILHAFTGGADGGQPIAGLTMDGNGNLYGTTAGGGNSGCAYFAVGCGVVFKIDSSNHFTVLYSFAGGSDSGVPESRLNLDSSGSIYGSTSGVGAGSQGTIFKLDARGHETVLLTFQGTNGSQPYGSLAIDAKGDLYGTTYGGGNLNDCNQGFGCGIVFELKPDGQEPILSVFTGGSGGWGPVAGLVRDKKGTLYGTAALGGEGTDCCGVVFQVTSNGVESVLHSFTDGADGGSPDTDLTQDSHGNLYGSAQGGTYGAGVIYKIVP